MRPASALLAVVLLAGCTTSSSREAATTPTPPLSLVTTSTTSPPTTLAPTTTAAVEAVGGRLVKLDPGTLEPAAGLESIPMAFNSWHLTSADGSRMVVFEYEGEALDEITSIDVENWEIDGTFAATDHNARVVHGASLYMYAANGDLLDMELETGAVTKLGEWPPGLWFWDELHVWRDGSIVGLGGSGGDVADEYSLLTLDPVTGRVDETPIGPIQRLVGETGVFDGDHEIPEQDTPGVAWGDSAVYVVHADDLVVMSIDDHGVVHSRDIDATNWWGRLFENWAPRASAKGPSLGTYSSAALSPDGRFLFISGNRYTVAADRDGQLVEQSEPLGLVVVDTDTWSVIEQPDLPLQFVRGVGRMIIGVHTTSSSPWVDEIYVVRIEEDGAMTYHGPVSGRGGCQPTLSETLVCFERYGTAQRLHVVDLATLESTVRTEIGAEDQLEPNGVLVDWNPDPSIGG